MLIKLLAVYASSKGTYKPGMKLDLPEAEASELIKYGYAVAVVNSVEVAIEAPETETAEIPTAKKKRGK